MMNGTMTGAMRECSSKRLRKFGEQSGLESKIPNYLIVNSPEFVIDK